MKLDNGSLMFNMNLTIAGNTPAWGTSLGQSEILDYRFTKDDYEKIITSMVYKKINDMDKLDFKLGRAGADQSNYCIVLAALYDKVYVNNILVDGAKFILVISQELAGANKGRRTLKYNPKIAYDDFSNEMGYELIRKKFDIQSDGAWFVTDIYTKNQDELHFNAYFPNPDGPLTFENGKERKKSMDEYVSSFIFDKDTIGDYSDNIIYYGVPGTGKSYEIDQITKDIENDNKFRVTFHPEYTYNDFVGQLLPVINEDGKITYDFVEGPFTKALKRAYERPYEKVYLIIEEMSRGNCAAIFGDLFQLLDRADVDDSEKEYKKGWSMYKVDNAAIASKIPEIYGDKIQIPANLILLGTVNTSDQNVFVMDTAFKRRFNWKYVSTKPENIEDSDEYKNDVSIKLKKGEETFEVSWVKLYQTINQYISSKEKLGLGEDKQIGQFFIKFNDENYKTKIRDKLLQYLWFDINENSYNEKTSLFDNEIDSFSKLYEKYDKDEQIFSNEFIEDLKK